MMEKLLSWICRVLPLYGLPIVLGWISKFAWRSRSLRQLQIGEMILDLDIADNFMRNMYFGLYERDLVRLIERILGRGDTFIDVGANMGFLTVYAYARVGQNGAVHCFEPVPQYAEYIERMARPLKSGCIVVNKVAVADRDGEVTIKILGAEKNIGMNSIVPDFIKEDPCASLVVPMTTLSKYIREHNLEEVRMIKIDVEGAETLVLLGLFDFLDTGVRPVIVTEVTPRASALLGTDFPAIVARMRSYGYRPMKFDRRGIRKFIRLSLQLVPVNPLSLKEVTDITWLPSWASSLIGIGYYSQ